MKKRKTLPDLPPDRRKSASRFTSKYVGVCWVKGLRKWVAQMKVGGKQNNLGYYVNEKEAARMYDEQAALLGKPMNFPLHEGMEQAVKRIKDRSKVPNVNRPSKYVGVSWSKQMKKWQAAITTGGKRKSPAFALINFCRQRLGI